MNKITQKPQLNIQYVSLNKAQTDSFRHSMIMKTSQYLNNQVSSSKRDSNIITSENADEKSIFIKKDALQRTISVYQWRYKTCYPVIKPTRLVVKSFTGNLNQKKTLCKRNSQNPFQIWSLDQNIFELVIITQKVSYRLSQIGSLSLPQLFYLLKQILVGFQCLIDIFGLFQPTQQMIIVNSQNQWRFWISEDFASNSKKQNNISEPQFILKIIKMVQSRLSNSKVGMKFFDDLKNLPIRSLTFLNLIDMTNIFISLNKIMVAKKFVCSNGKSGNSLYGSKNQSYFGQNKTYMDLRQGRQTPKSNQNDKTFNNFYTSTHLQQQNSSKNICNMSKLNTMKSLNEKMFNKKQISNLKMNLTNFQQKKQKEIKSHMKISQFLCADAIKKNNIQKRNSFLFTSKDLIKQSIKQEKCNLVQFGMQMDKFPASPRNTISYNNEPKKQLQKNINNRILSPLAKQRKLSFQNSKQKYQNSDKPIKNHQILTVTIPKKQRKNSHYQIDKPLNKQAFSQSPKRHNKNKFLEDKQKQKQKQKVVLRNSIKNQQASHFKGLINRSRKLSQHAPRMKSLDQIARKNKKMCQSNLLESNELQKKVKYGNLKMKDIACHTRNATITGLAFGQPINHKKVDHSFNNINNDLYNGKFEQIMKSIKSRSNDGKDDNKNDDFDETPKCRGRRATTFQMIRDTKQRKNSIGQHNQIPQKQIVRISNANNQTAQTLNKSQLHLIKGSQQSNSISNNKAKQSQSSNQKSPYLYVNRKGMIGESNLSMFSCKTHQPLKDSHDVSPKLTGVKYMTTSQDCFNKNQSQSSQQFLKSNNWNKKISGLFSDVASIKVLKQSNHFGDQFDVFQKQYLRDVKLQKLDKFGKQLKCSIIQGQDGRHILNLPTRGGHHNKSFSLIGQVKQQPYENDPSYLEYSTSMICQSKHQQEKFSYRGNGFDIPEMDRNLKNCQSFEQQMPERQKQQKNGGFSFQTQLYKITHNM